MTIPSFNWLPEHHLGVVAALAHADELIEQIGDLLFDYLTQEEGPFDLEEVRVGAVSQTVVKRIEPLPRRVPLLVADALVTLRAAMEHTLFAEAQFINGAPLEEKEAKAVEMPAARSREDFEEWIKKQARRAPTCLRNGGELLHRVRELQPYQRNASPAAHPMALLATHTNHAKHRTPAITAARIVAIVRDNELPRSVHDLPPHPEEPLRVGLVIAETPLGQIVPTTLFPTVGLNRPGTEEWPILMHELDYIATWVRTQGVPLLITGAGPREPALPTRYEIGVGHEVERSAIAEGSAVSAMKRNQQRLGAASTRQDWVDLLSSLPDAPDAQEIARWLAELTDEEVLDRAARLVMTHDPGEMRRNCAVLMDLRDEAAAFTDKQNHPAK